MGPFNSTTMVAVNSTIKLFHYYKHLGDESILQLTEEQLFYRSSEWDNSIAIIVKHLWGNMLSRWTDIWTSDGEKEWRDREAEFDDDIKTREELLSKWEEGWSCLFAALDTINETNMKELIYIRHIGHTPIEAIHRQLSHYAYHIGQIVYLAKGMKKNDWQSLSIPRGKSKDYNAQKFNKPKERGHFTQEFLKTNR